jgi:hypothetical protein
MSIQPIWASDALRADSPVLRLISELVSAEERCLFIAGGYKPGERVETRRAFVNGRVEFHPAWGFEALGTRTTGEILNYVYFQAEPMEATIRNQPLDFSLIATERPAVYSRSSSGKSPADIRQLRAKFEHLQAENA